MRLSPVLQEESGVPCHSRSQKRFHVSGSKREPSVPNAQDGRFLGGLGDAGSRHGASRLREGSHHGGVHYGPGGVPVAHEGAHHHHHHHNGIPGPLHPNGTSPFFELPGQGGPLQDGAGVCTSIPCPSLSMCSQNKEDDAFRSTSRSLQHKTMLPLQTSAQDWRRHRHVAVSGLVTCPFPLSQLQLFCFVWRERPRYSLIFVSLVSPGMTAHSAGHLCCQPVIRP